VTPSKPVTQRLRPPDSGPSVRYSDERTGERYEATNWGSSAEHSAGYRATRLRRAPRLPSAMDATEPTFPDGPFPR
jgi:hypothetical protein